MLRKNIRKTISILQNISLYKNPKELLYYLDDNNKMGHENNTMILKLDLKYFWIEFSTPSLQDSLTLGGHLYREQLCVELAREMLRTRWNSCLYFGGFSFFQYKLIWHEPSPQYEAGMF